MQTPSLGRVVIVPMDPTDNNGSFEAPATITHVFAQPGGGWLVNVRILSDSNLAPTWRTSQRLCEEKPENTPGAVWWPPRV